MEKSTKQNRKFEVLTLFLYFVLSFFILLISCTDINLDGLNSFKKEISSFSFLATENSDKLDNDLIGTIDSDTITITVPSGIDLNLIPTITYIGKTLNPKNNKEQTFVNGVKVPYTVYGEDDSEKTYDVIVNVVSTFDNTPPVPGNSGLITFSGATAYTIDLSWTKATDNFSAQGNLDYLVYYSTSNNIGTVADMEANGTSSGISAADINTKTVTGLNDSTTYYFNVLVRDEANNKAAYTSANYTMPDAIPPAQATITRVTEADSQISIDWTDPADGDFDHIEITWTPDGTGTTNVSKGIVTFTANSLTNETVYTFSIVSVDDATNKSAAVTVKVTPHSAAPFSSYCIYTAYDLNAVRGGIKTGWDKTKSYIVMADIDLASYSPWTPLGTSSSDVFSGNFNGNGHDITNLSINTTSDYQGLFGYIDGSSIIKNVRIINCDITGGVYVAGLVGCFDADSNDAEIADCYVSGSISTNIASGQVYVAGLAGRLIANGALSTCDALRCDTNVTITMPSDSTTYIFIGGLVARQESGWYIKQCYSIGNFVNTGATAYVGGLVADSSGIIYDSYSRIHVTGFSFIGGFAGRFINDVFSSYATGDITEGSPSSPTTFGGFSGSDTDPAPDSYYCGTLYGSISDNAIAIRKTGPEMQIQSTFTGWDFTTIWDIDPLINDGYPYLRNNMPE